MTRRAPPPGSPIDQAHGLRQMFVQHEIRFVPVAANPFMPFAGVLLERLCTALAELELQTLVIDASESAQAPKEWTALDLAEGIETLSPQVSYLSAPGMPLRYLDAEGSTSAFLDAVAHAAPQADIVLVHAGASELARMFGTPPGETPPRLLVLCDEHIDSLKEAYANIKFMATRGGTRVHDTLITVPPGSGLATQIAQRLGRCGEAFLGTVQHACVAVDPMESASAAPAPDLLALAAELHRGARVQTVSESAFGALAPVRSASASLHTPR